MPARKQTSPLRHRLAEPGHDQRYRPQQSAGQQHGREIDD
jgi:hypothetical protein